MTLLTRIRLQTLDRESHKGGHIIATSSLGKDLDPKHVAPAAKLKTYLKSIRGGTFDHLKSFIVQTPFQHKSVSLLVGGNDLDDGVSAELCYDNYKDLIKCVWDNNPGASINRMELPPRIHSKHTS